MLTAVSGDLVECTEPWPQHQQALVLVLLYGMYLTMWYVLDCRELV